MDDEPEHSLYAAAMRTVTEGPWAGWSHYPGGDPFEDLTGPFYFRTGDDGRPVCAFRAEARHMNAGGFLHGGCLMTFADFALFILAGDAIEGERTVTATFNGEFVGSARVGDIVECTGEVVKATRSMVFIRGLMTCAGEPIMSFSSVLKKTGAWRPPA